MIRPVFLLFEVMTYALFATCLWHAARQGRHRVLELVAGLLYGVFLELMTIRQLQGYSYGQFLIMIDDAPLAIGMGWTVIIYSAMELSSRLAMPTWARPWLDGLLALNIDLAMDAVAIRLLMWTWVIPLDQEWYGVPWGNFWAWFIVVASFSASLRLMRYWRTHRVLGWLYPLLALLASIVILAITNQLYVSVLHPASLGFAATALLVGAGVVITLLTRPRPDRSHPPTRIDVAATAVPVVFHLFFSGAGIIYGYYAAYPVLLLTGIVMLIGGLAVHLWPWWTTRHSMPSAKPA